MTTRIHSLIRAGLALALLSVAACDDTTDPEFRAGDFWDQGLGLAGNGDLEIYDGAETTDPGCLIWILDGGIILETSAASGTTAPFKIGSVDANTIDAGGAGTCTAEVSQTGFGNIYKLRDASGLVVSSSWNQYLFDGDVAPTSASNLMSNFDVAYEFDHAHIRYGDGEIAATATEYVHAANPMRKLALGAMLDGACGSHGLP